MKKIAALGMIAITIVANVSPISVKAAGVSTNYQCYGNNVVSSGYQCPTGTNAVSSGYQCPTGTNAVVIDGNCNSDEIKSKLQEAGINSNCVNGVYSINSQNCPTSSEVIKQISGQANAKVADTANCNLASNNTTNGNLASNDTTNCNLLSNDTTSNDTTSNDTTSNDTTSNDTTSNDTTSNDTTSSNVTNSDAITTTTQTTTDSNTTTPSVTNTSATNTKAKNTTTANTSNDKVNTDTQTTNTNLSYAQQVVDLVNVERAKEGLSALTIDQNVVNAAMIRANEIQTKFEHVRPDGSPFVTALKENGVSYRGAGENIAWGQKTPEEVVNAWMNSPGHRANIMNPNFVHIGVGNLQNSAGTQYWVQIFTY